MPLREFDNIETPSVLTKNLKTMKFLLKIPLVVCGHVSENIT